MLLPQDAIVDLVAAYPIRQLDRVTGHGVMVSIKVLDMTQAVAPQKLSERSPTVTPNGLTKLEVVGIDPSAIAAQVEGALPRIRSSTVTIRNDHLGERKPVEHASAIVSNVAKSQALAPTAEQCQRSSQELSPSVTYIVEPDPHPPLLPSKQIAICLEGRTLRLYDLIRFRRRPSFSY